MRNPENYFYFQQSKKAVKITIGVNKNELSYTHSLDTIHEEKSDDENSYEEDSYKLILEQARARDLRFNKITSEGLTWENCPQSLQKINPRKRKRRNYK